MFTKGDIIRPIRQEKDRAKLFHAAVLLDDAYLGFGNFNGIMLTKAGREKGYDNILMRPQDFERQFEFRFNNTHFVNQVFIKLEPWGPFKKVGKLTREGLIYVSENLTLLSPMLFDDYIAKMLTP